MAKLRKRGRVWYSDLRIGGKRVVRALSTDRQIAESRLADLIKEKDASKYGHGRRDSPWADFRAKYLAARTGKKYHTQKRDDYAIRSLEGYTTLYRLAQITPELLETWKNKRRSEGYGVATINRDLRAVKTMLHKAVEWGYMTAQRWSTVKQFKETRGRLYFYSREELKRLLRVCRGQWLTVALLGARAGLRRSEIYWLSWDDVDLGRGMLSVTPKGEWTPKDYEVRHVPLSKDLAAHLAKLPRLNEWVLGKRPKDEDVITAYMRKKAKSVGLKGSVHVLRHTFASHLAMAGVPLFTISKLLGHSDMNMTQVYSHLQPSTMEKAISMLPGL